MMIDLRSDTVTKPTQEMLSFMLKANVGDDVFEEDTTVAAFENEVANLFGHESGLFCPSGTMTNQIAIKAHTQPLDEIICSSASHIYNFEVGSYAFHSGVSIKLIEGKNGVLLANTIEDNIQPKQDWTARTSLVVAENTVNRGGGACYSLTEMQELQLICKKNNLKLHLDGARIFNAMQAMEYSALEVGSCFDSISICFSKGLGAPVGSVLIGNKDWIKHCRRIRKAMGGGMRQSGILAAAASFALNNHLPYLAKDHKNATLITNTLQSLPYINQVLPTETNIVIASLHTDYNVQEFVHLLSQHNILCVAFGKNSFRMVTHFQITDADIDFVISTLKNLRLQKSN